MAGIKLTKKQSRQLRAGLPSKAVKEIADTLNLSSRMVQYVIDGKFGDRHGIIEMALKHKEKETIRRQQLLESII